MCGIAGFAGQDEDRIEKMTRALEHRGPDGRAVCVEQGASLGHTRLAILDPRPDGNQPMWNDSRTVAIVYNGEIFNFRELREKHRLTCKTETDTEVLLRLYEKTQMEFVSQLRGMFAFAIFDARENTWHLARDPSGIKPLFVAYPEGKLAFASEVRALMNALPQKPAINTYALSQYLRLQYVPGPQTLCEGIESLPPGTVLRWQNGKETRKHVAAAVDPMKYATAAEFQEQFPSLMNTVVHDHLVSDKPVGIFLSGGMDSSIALHHMCQHASAPVQTFTIRFDATAEEGAERFNRDADLAAKTAAHYGTEHHDILLTAELCRGLYSDAARAMDQPNADSVSTAQFLLSREAKKTVDVVLCGTGGDELFGGYPRYRIAKILHQLRFIPAPLRAFAGKLTGNPSDVLAMSPGAALAERLLGRPTKEIRSIANGDWFSPGATADLFEKVFAEVSSKSPVRSFMEFDRHTWLVDESLRLADAMTMGNGLECRVPFLDSRIITAAHGTNDSWFIQGNRTKALLKEAYETILPEHLYSLGKACFYPPLAKWLRRECSPLVEQMLEGTHIQEYFDAEELRSAYDRHCNGGYELHTLSSLIQLHFWFETVYAPS